MESFLEINKLCSPTHTHTHTNKQTKCAHYSFVLVYILALYCRHFSFNLYSSWVRAACVHSACLEFPCSRYSYILPILYYSSKSLLCMLLFTFIIHFSVVISCLFSWKKYYNIIRYLIVILFTWIWKVWTQYVVWSKLEHLSPHAC